MSSASENFGVFISFFLFVTAALITTIIYLVYVIWTLRIQNFGPIIEKSPLSNFVDFDDPELQHHELKWAEARRKLALATPAASWMQRKFEPHGTYGFVKYSGYRLGPSEMAAVGLGTLALWGRRRVGSCQWIGDEGQVLMGKTDLIHGLEHHDLQYHVLIIWCKLDGSTDPGTGGVLTIEVDNEVIVVYKEEPGEFKVTTPRRPFKRNITHCSPPIHDGVDAGMVKIWLEYHMRMGFDHFVMYDVNGIDQEMGDMLKPYIDAGIVEITDFSDVLHYPSWYFGQVLIINDCIYRFRFTSRWVAYLDFDEFMWVNNGKTLKHILQEYKDKAFVQHGTKLWNIHKCLPEERDSSGRDQRSVLERAIFRSPEPFCRSPTIYKPTCYDYWGHRKYFGNPRRLVLLENHRVVNPNDQGVSLSTDVMLNHHLRGLVTKGFGHCNETTRWDDVLEDLVKDTNIAEAVKEIRTHPISLDEWVEKRRLWEARVDGIWSGGK